MFASYSQGNLKTNTKLFVTSSRFNNTTCEFWERRPRGQIDTKLHVRTLLVFCEAQQQSRERERGGDEKKFYIYNWTLGYSVLHSSLELVFTNVVVRRRRRICGFYPVPRKREQKRNPGISNNRTTKSDVLNASCNCIYSFSLLCTPLFWSIFK